ncbi:anthranilate synthase component 1 [Dermabacteraceae bacterium P7074]
MYIVQRELRCSADALNLFAALANTTPDTVLLESADTTTRESKRSLLLLSASVRITCRGTKVKLTPVTKLGQMVCAEAARAFPVESIENSLVCDFPRGIASDENERLREPNPLDVLRFLTSLGRTPENSLALPLLAGAFAYEFIDSYEELPTVTGGAATPEDFYFLLGEELVQIDHVAQTAQLSVAAENRELAEAKLAVLEERVTAALAESQAAPVGAETAPVKTPEDLLTAHASMSDSDFMARVKQMQEHIAAGDIYQVVPSRSFALPCPDPVAAYRVLRQQNPSPYMFLLRTAEEVLFGASPEASVTVSGGEVSMYPIAGTRPRGLGANGEVLHELDTRRELDLRTDPKELSEHIMLVDLARNDLARIAKPGTRKVDKLLGVDRYSRVMHLVSRVVAELDDGLDALDAYRACMNMGTLTGAPKLSATALLRAAEGCRRGFYGGAVGYFTGGGEMDTCIVIRSAYVRDGVAHVQAGAGVVRDSDPRAEADETVHKAMAVLGAIAAAQGRTVEVVR